MVISDIVNYIVQIKDFIIDFVTFFYEAFDILPIPLNNIARGGFMLLVALVIIKILRG